MVYTIINTRVISGKIWAASSSKRGSEIAHFAQVVGPPRLKLSFELMCRDWARRKIMGAGGNALTI